jgi:DNA-binding response OmpR family regulator
MGLRRQKVLIVDDEDAIALSLHRLLYQRCDRFDTLVTRTAETARELMREIRIDVLVSDILLPGMSGVDLACWSAKESPDTQVILMSSHETKALPEKLPQEICLRFLEKPFEPNALLKIVDEAMDCAERLSGRLSAAGDAADVIQFLCIGRRTAELRITAGETAGCVIIEEGRLVHASWGDKTGEFAVCEMLAIDDGIFRMRAKRSGPEPTIFRDWQHVLIDAARILDERKSENPKRPKKRLEKRIDRTSILSVYPEKSDSDNGHSSGVRSVTVVTPPEGADSESIVAAAKLVDKGFAALKDGNREEARRCWEAAKELNPENRAIDLNLRKLGNLSARG